MIPTAVAGRDRTGWSAVGSTARAFGWLAATYVALVWADPTWAYDASWFVKPYQLHWPALREAGDWIKAHPEQVPPDARVMTWFPWEFRGRQRPDDRAAAAQLQCRGGSTRSIRQYRVTHVLWGSFEPPPHVDPETWGPYLEQVRTALGLTESRELYPSPRELLYPVRLYRLPLGTHAMRWSDPGPGRDPDLRCLVSRAHVRADGRRGDRAEPVAGGRRARRSRSTATRRSTRTSAGGMLAGDVMYRDLTENKPPLGYWLYALAVAVVRLQRAGHPPVPDPATCWRRSRWSGGSA